MPAASPPIRRHAPPWQLDLATQYFEQAREICPHDPLVYNELGALSYKNGDYEVLGLHSPTPWHHC